MKHNLLKGLLLLILSLYSSNITTAQGFYSTASAKKVVDGSHFQYSIVIDNIKASKITPPNFGKLRLLNGPSQSTSTSIINGREDTKKEYIYTLTAHKPGIYTIGKASAIVNNKKVYSKSLKIEFIKPNMVKKNDDENPFFVKMVPSDTVVYIGQQLIINYIVYTQVNIQAASSTKESNYDGFFLAGKNKNGNVNFSRSNNIEDINGVQYHTSIIKQVSLYPQQTGTYNIERAVFKIGRSNGNNRRRSIFYQNNLKFKSIATNGLKILVKDTPQPIPTDFISNVGDFKIQAKLDRNQVQNKKAFNIIVIYEGDGDPKMFKPAILELGENFEVYDPVLIEEQSQEKYNKRIFSRKYQYMVVPQKEGLFNIKVEASYFNADSIRYLKLTKGPYRIKVLEGKIIEKIVDNTELKILSPNWTGDKLKPSKSLYNKNGVNGFILLSFLSILGMIGAKIYQNQTSDERAEKKRQKELHDRVLTKLKDAKSFLGTDNTRAFHDETFKATQKYLSDKFGMEIGNITSQNVQKTLDSFQVEQSIIDHVKIILDESQLAIFGGMMNRPMQETYDNLTQIIESIESK